MKIGLTQTAKILSITADEVMFLHQSNKLNAYVDKETLEWNFDMEEVLTLKANREN